VRFVVAAFFSLGQVCRRWACARAQFVVVLSLTLRSIEQVHGSVKFIGRGGKRMGGFGNLGLTEILVILGICGLCLLPIAVGGIAAVIVLISRKKQL
jgi:hypothetical protein